MDLIWIIPLCIVAALILLNIMKAAVITSEVAKNKYLNYINPKGVHYKEPISGFADDDMNEVIANEIERRVDIEVNGFIDEWKKHQA